MIMVSKSVSLLAINLANSSIKANGWVNNSKLTAVLTLITVIYPLI